MRYRKRIFLSNSSKRLRIKDDRTHIKEESQSQTTQTEVGRGRDQDPVGCSLTSEVKSRREGTSALATNLSAITRNTRILCQKIRSNQSGISQSSELKRQNKLQDDIDCNNRWGRQPQKVEAVFIYCFSYFLLSSHFNIWDTLLLRLLFMPVGLVSHCYLGQSISQLN